MNKFDLLSRRIGDFLLTNNFTLITAESLTAGLVSAIVANTPGSSSWLEGGFNVYSEAAKHKALGVSLYTIDKYDVTSQEVAKEMSEGALANSFGANVAVSTTGLAGPTGGSPELPIGTVCFGWSFKLGIETHTFTEKQHFSGTRQEIREQSAIHALSQIEHYYQQLIGN